jgi:hypothetical protein
MNIIRIFIKHISIIIIFMVLTFSISYTQIKSAPGAFTRMGFDAKGLSMGNAGSTITSDNYTTYYNPALCSFQEKPTVSATYTFLDLDRNLNTLCYIQQVRIKQEDTTKTLFAGFAAGLINAGVSDIEERDIDGFLTQTISTFENQFFFSFAARFVEDLSIGATFKFYYSKLYEDVTSSGFGVDIGILYIVNDKLSVSGVIKEINSTYIWDTFQLYGQSGNTTKDKFPLLKKIGASYKITNMYLVVVEFENSNQGTNILRIGCEISLLDFLCLRAGVDRLDLSNSDNGIKPCVGFGLTKDMSSFDLNLNYAFCLEPFTHSPFQMVTLTAQF